MREMGNGTCGLRLRLRGLMLCVTKHLNPQAGAARAQAAFVLMRYVKTFA